MLGSSQITAKAESNPINNFACSCIQTARILGANIPLGNNAENIAANSYPIVGGLVLFSYKVKHVAFITKLEETGFWVKEGNFIPCTVGVRFIRWNDPFITGFVDTSVIDRYLASLTLKTPQRAGFR